jgi:hypothetical protein
LLARIVDDEAPRPFWVRTVFGKVNARRHCEGSNESLSDRVERGCRFRNSKEIAKLQGTRRLNSKEDKVKRGKWFIVTFCLTVLCALAAPSAMMADEWDKATKLTFSEPVEVPGQVLPPGTYWFTLADSESDRNIVQIWNADRTRLVTTILAIPDYRLQPQGRTVIHFEERPSDQPEAIHSWFYPGDNFGQEFVYPKTRATQLAKQTSRPVLSMPDEQASSTAQVKQVPVKAVTPSGEEIETTEVVASQPVMQQEAANNSLPKTASSLPLWGLLGLLSSVAGFMLRAATRKVA